MYTSDVDDREFGPDPDEDACATCGAAWDDPCTPECDCLCCLRVRVNQRDADALLKAANIAQLKGDAATAAVLTEWAKQALEAA